MDQQNASLKTHPISSALQSASAVSAMQSWAFAAIMVSFPEHKDYLLIRIYYSLSFPQILIITAASPFRQCSVLIYHYFPLTEINLTLAILSSNRWFFFSNCKWLCHRAFIIIFNGKLLHYSTDWYPWN